MKNVIAQRLAWSLAVASMLMMLTGIVLSIVHAAATGEHAALLSHQLLVPLSTLIYSVLGALVASRHPRNPISWIFACVGLLYGLNALSVGFSVYAPALTGPTSQTVVALARWLDTWVWIPGTLLPITFVFLLFPDGQLPSLRWRLVAWASTLGLAAIVIGVAFHPGPLESSGASAANPFGLQGAAPALEAAANIGSGLFGVGLLGSLGALTVRFRRSQGVEREQLKWLVYASGIMVVGVVFGAVVWAIWPGNPVVAELSIVITSLVILGIAVAAGIAIRRYRLYDIDLIINRTLVYGALTATVAGLYVLMVGGAGVLFQNNRAPGSALLATLIIAVTIRPVHRRLQSGMDHWIPGRARWAAPTPPTPDRTTVRQGEAAPTPLSGYKLRLARFAWVTAAVVALGIIIASLPAYLVVAPQGFAQGRFAPNASPWVVGLNVVAALLSLAGALLSLFLAGVLFRRRASDRMALFLSFYLLSHAVLMSGPLEALEAFVPGIARFTTLVLQPGVHLPASFVLFAVFPDGRFVPGWTRWVVPGAAAVAALSPFIWPSLSVLSLDRADPLQALLLAVGLALWVAISISALYAQIYRYWQVSTPLQKQQTKWVVFGIGLWFLLQILSGIPWVYSFSLGPGTSFEPWLAMASVLWFLSLSLIPASLTIAVLRHRLYDVDFIINRTLVYAALTTVVVGIYVLVVGGLGVLIQASGNLLVSLLATGLAAILFQPLRERLQSGINRLMYGERDDPYAVLARLSRRLEANLPPQATLPSVVETVAQALKLPYVAIALEHGDDVQIVASYGLPTEAARRLPLVYQGRTIGQLLLAPRAVGEPFTPAEERLLEQIAHQTSAAAHAVQLTEDLRRTAGDLQRSRERLVAMREEERRRVRRDLHDGLGPTLAAQTLKVGSARALLAHDPAAADRLLAELESGIEAALADIRRLVYDLRPPELDELGLVGAIRESAAQYGLRGDAATRRDGGATPLISVEAPDRLPPLPAAAEVAVYRIAQEALTNVVRHARARTCRVRLALDERLQLTVSDDGIGLPPTRRAGVGLASMRERAEELGGSCVVEPRPTGGTRVVVQLPLAEA